MSDHNPKAMNKEELEKYIEKDFLPGLLSSVPNVPDLTGENARLKAEVKRLRKAGDKMAKTLEKDQQRYNGCPSAEAEMWWIARDGGCP